MSSPRPPAVLVVDDRADQRLSLGAVLSEIGVELVEAASGREALRWLLRRQFAVILLDVNMPDMDGFETAALIRARPSSEHTPIIFVTADGDDTLAARGYSLGAVDYILAPVDPGVLRTKVSVFLDLFRKTEQIARQAQSLRHHAGQLRRIADAAIAIHAARSLDDLVKVAADTALSIFGAGQVAIELETASMHDLGVPSGSREARYAVCRPERGGLEKLGQIALAQARPRPIRLSREELDRHPDWAAFVRASEPPLRGWIAAPLSSRNGRLFGWIQLSDAYDGQDFSAEDEIVLVQLAQMTAIAAENTLFDEVHEVSRLKDRFLATLSHELRNPLQSILSWAHLLQDPGVDGAIVRRGLEVIERNARAQNRLIEDLLDVSRIISGKLALERRLVSLAEVVDTAIEESLPAAHEKKVELLRHRTASPGVVGDPNRLRQVVVNVLSNAVKFTPSGGRVAVSLGAEGEEARIAVEDDGQGIEPEFLPHLFDPFRQADSTTTRVQKGLGIGLAIVRQLVELHGGSVRADSDGQGKGARFTIRLPLAEASVAPSCATPAPARSAVLAGVRVLVVEDEADTRDSLARGLEHHGAEVVAVESAASALLALDEGSFDVLLSDLGMPGEDGYSLVRRVRARSPERGGRMPAVAVSAYARSDERSRAVSAGFDAHVAKPVEPAALAAAVLQATSRPRA